MSFDLIVTTSFEKDVKILTKKYPSVGKDLKELFDQLKNDPLSGTPLGKNCYKLRLAISSKNKGKSGGARVITCVKTVENNIFLLRLYDKSEKESIDDKELLILLQAAGLS